MKMFWKKMSIVKHLKKGKRPEIFGGKIERQENQDREKLDLKIK